MGAEVVGSELGDAVRFNTVNGDELPCKKSENCPLTDVEQSNNYHNFTEHFFCLFCFVSYYPPFVLLWGFR